MNVAPLINHELGLEEVRTSLDGKIQGVSKAVVKVGGKFRALCRLLSLRGWRRKLGRHPAACITTLRCCHHLPPAEGRGFVSRFSPPI